MASTSTKAATTKSILKPVTTLKGHRIWIRSISYFPDGQRMISGSEDQTARQWDVKAGKEIEKARDVCEKAVHAVAISRDGRWVATGGGDYHRGELKVCEVETGIVKTFKGHSDRINCIDISADNTWLASGSWDFTARIWSLDTGKLVAGPFKSEDWVGAVRFSTDSKKLAVKSWVGKCLEVWDIQSQKLDVRIGTYGGDRITYAPVFWTNDNKNIEDVREMETLGPVYHRLVWVLSGGVPAARLDSSGVYLQIGTQQRQPLLRQCMPRRPHTEAMDVISLLSGLCDDPKLAGLPYISLMRLIIQPV